MDSFLVKFVKNADTNQTHISMNGGKYVIPDKYIKEFYKTYYITVIKNRKDAYLVEKITDINFAFFVDVDNKSNDITDEIVKDLLEKFDKCIKDCFEIENVEYILSKRESKYHINYPGLIVNSYIANKIVDFIDCKYIDKSVYRTGLRMIGSRKVNDPSYYKIYDINKKEYIDIDLKIFLKTIIRKPTSNITDLTEYGKNIIKIIQNDIPKLSEKKIDVKSNGIDNVILKEIEDMLIYLKNTEDDLINFDMTISRIYAKRNSYGLFCYYLGLNNKFCPFKNTEHARETSPIYIEINCNTFSIKCHDTDHTGKLYGCVNFDKYPEFQTKFKNLFDSMKIVNLKPDIYISEEIKHTLENSLTGTHYKISEVIFNIYNNRFCVDSIKNPTWYEFNGVRWEESVRINILISKEIPKYYLGIKIKPENANDDEDKSIKNKMVDNIIKCLENVGFKNSILNQLSVLYKNDVPRFYTKLDENPYLLGFNNGIYDFKTNTFRNGVYNDYITFSTGYDYIQYDETNVFVQEIYTTLQNIITNKKVYEYLLKILGKSLVGLPDEKFYIFTGVCGANGKSTLINLLENTLGDYMTSVDTSLLVNKRGNSSSASPDIVRLRGKRFLSFQEPEFNDSLRTGLLKQFSGGDTIIARDLFKPPITFKLQGIMVMCCNDLPTIPSSDGGTWRRVRVIDFNSRFLDNPNPKRKNEFKKDPCLKNKMKIWKPYFMSILIHWYKKQLDEGIDEPSEVLHATEKYREDNNKFTPFINECVEEDENSFVSIDTIYNTFSNWWQEKYNNNNNKFNIPSEKELIKSLKFKYGPLIERKVGKIMESGYNISLNFDESCTLQDDDSMC